MGLSAFLVPTDVPGFTVTKFEDKRGLGALSNCAPRYENVRVPAWNRIGREAAMAACTDAVQIMGGKGYMKDGPAEKIFRDIKVYCIFEGTTQVQKMVISGALLAGGGH